MAEIIQPGASFRDNLKQLPPIEDVHRIDLIDESGSVVACIENVPGKQGSLAVYHYLEQVFGKLDGEAAAHGLTVFAEHVAEARSRPGAHPNIDRLFAIAAGDPALSIRVVG